MTNMELIAAELDAAKKKHPTFCDRLIDTRVVKWAESEAAIKRRNEHGPISADNILMEEVAEAFAAVERGDLAHARQELAQCAAVCIRAMEHVQILRAAGENENQTTKGKK